MRAIIYILGLFAFGSCVPDVFLSFSTRKANGLRMKNPKRFKFPGEQILVRYISFLIMSYKEPNHLKFSAAVGVPIVSYTHRPCCVFFTNKPTTLAKRLSAKISTEGNLDF
jgi:hypothetical protein